ncbi:MAG: hypothetical protein PVF05_02790 [Gemmatimonadales bacterium]|jgi:hypothetical protein
MSIHELRRTATRLGILGAGVLTLGLAACDETPGERVTGASDATSVNTEREAHIPGGGNGTAVYQARLRPLNASAEYGIAPVSGTATITERGDEITVRVNARGLAPNTVHLQHIHGAGSCPTAAQDVNGDGFVSVGEGAPVYGPIVVPLDDDLADLGMQVGGFPAPANRGGAEAYVASDSKSALDAAVSAAFGTNLDLASRHIVVHGVAPETGLPETVGSIGGFPAELTLPVACGEIVQVN